jgi:hypothetical protein
MNRDLGKGPATGRTGGGNAEANPELDHARQMARKRAADPIQKKVRGRGGKRAEK